jgi:mRNA-binding protein PUF3
VQDAFENSGCDEERTALASELVGHVWEALKCMNANHVLQKCITTIRPSTAQFVIDELSQHGPKGVVQAAKHRFGCRVLQRLLEQCMEEQMSSMVEVLLNDAVDLASHTYGHYVMMHIFEQGGQDVVSRLASTLQQHLPDMVADGYIGAVIGKALNHTNNEACVSLAAGLLQEHAHMVSMACSRWGYVAIKQALQLVSTFEQDKACNEIAYCSSKLRSSRYGRLVATFVMELQAKASA